ncbi:MAG: serine/threonine protein kinase [Gemmataceae bacterium]
MLHSMNLSLESKERINKVCDAFEDDILAGNEPAIQDHLDGFAGQELLGLVRELVALEVEYARKKGSSPTVEHYLNLVPNADSVLGDLFGPTDPPAAGRNGLHSSDRGKLLNLHLQSDLESDAANRFPKIPGYTIQKELGRGGMGIVYLAWNDNLNRSEALKTCFHGDLTAEDVKRFKQEMRTLAKLKHNDIVSIFHADEFDGIPYFTMEFANGGTLRDYLKKGEGLPPKQAAQVVKVLAEAVLNAHKSQVIHRDLKPSNVLVCFPQTDSLQRFNGEPKWAPLFFEGTVLKISDFGLAKGIEGNASGSAEVTVFAEQTQRITDGTSVPDQGGQQTHSFHKPVETRDGVVVGTVSYMAPEQAQGSKGIIDERADVYALGGILYRLLAGRPVVEANGATEGIEKVLNESPPALDHRVPKDLRIICERCLEKKPEDRYQSVEELGKRLSAYLQGIPDPTRPWPIHCLRFLQRNVVYAASVAMGLVALSVIALGMNYGPIKTAFGPKHATTKPDFDQVAATPEPAVAVLKKAKKKRREEIKQLVERGDEYVVSNVPDWHVWRMNQGAILEQEKEDWFRIQSKEYSLLELVPANNMKKFRITADIRHDQGEINSTVGLFFGGRHLVTPVGPIDIFWSVAFNDAAEFPPAGEVQGNPFMVCLDFRKKGRPVSWKPLNIPPVGPLQELGRYGGTQFLFTPIVPNREKNPEKKWRRLEVLASPEKITVKFGKGPMKETHLFADEFRTTYLKPFEEPLEGLGITWEEFDSTGSIGLLVDDTVASFKNVKIKRMQ